MLAASRVWTAGLRFACVLGVILSVTFFVSAPDMHRRDLAGQTEMIPFWSVVVMRIVTAAIALGAISALFASFIPTRVRAGSDGLLLQWARTERFIAFRDVARVDQYEEKANGFMANGVRLTLRDGSYKNIMGRSRDECEELVATIGRAWSQHAAWAKQIASVDVSLERGAQSLSEWVRNLRTMADGAPRAASIPRDQLFRIAENPATPPTQRIAASIAAASENREDVKARISRLAVATANPRLRVALEALANNDDTELENSLETLHKKTGP